MLQDVMIPLDGSDFAARAIPYAEHLLGTSKHLTLITVCESIDMTVYAFATTPAVVDFELLLAETMEDAKKYLEEVATSLREKGYIVETCVVVGEPAQEISRKAEDFDISAIVMTTHGRTGLMRAMLGSVADKILSLTSCPVLVIPIRDAA